MILKEHVKEILNLYNYFNMAIITNEKGIVEYFYNNRPDINSITEGDILGHCVLESCVNITEDTSSIFYALRTGNSVNNMYQELVNSNGDVIYNYCSVIPIKDGDKVIGAVEVSKYVDVASENRIDNRDFIEVSSLEEKKQDNLYTVNDIKGSSKDIERLKYKIERVANTDSTVLIYGETGTGKELVAESIHSCGKRKHKKFVSQNCAAIPPTLLEGILFGTEKGSFTGAEFRKGLLETASGGTLFLDEINTMDVNTQSKILKAIEEKKIMRVGGTEVIPVDIRIIAAVNIPPKVCLEKEYLREDLYYRLRVVELKIPPLRERKEDIPELIEFFIKYYNHRTGKYIAGLSSELTDFFMAYDWPGNVRELKNAIEGGFCMAVTPIIEIDDVSIKTGCSGETEDIYSLKSRCFPLKTVIKNRETEIIREIYKSSETISEAARKLGISRQALSKKLSELQII